MSVAVIALPEELAAIEEGKFVCHTPRSGHVAWATGTALIRNRRLRAGRGGHADTARTNFRYQFNPGDADPGAAAGQPRTGAAAVIV